MEFTFKHQPLQTKYELLKCMFKPTYIKYCRGHYTDDRRLFINMYRTSIKILLVWDTVYDKCAAVDCGIIDKWEEYKTNMQSIKERFEQFAREGIGV